MSTQTRRYLFDRILVDMNTQCDLLLPRGALPVTNRTEVLPNIRKLMNWARVGSIPIISSLECHRPSEPSRGLPPHCVDRSGGQRKIPFTLMPRRALVMGDNTMDIPADPFRRVQQLIITKRSRDFLANPKADRLFHSLSASYFVIFGTVAEHCVKAMALGLLARQHRVAIVTDACGSWSAGDAELAMRLMDAKGAVLVTTDELISGAATERILSSRVDAVIEEETETVGAFASQNGKDHGNAESPAKSNGQKRGSSNGNGNGHHDQAAKPLRPRLRPGALERLRPEGQLISKHSRKPQLKPPAGLA